MKILWFLFWAAMIVTGLTILAGYFMDTSITRSCSDTLISCLESSMNGSWWEKIRTACSCVTSNIICVFKQIGASF